MPSDIHALVTPDSSPSGAVRSLSIAEVGLKWTKMDAVPLFYPFGLYLTIAWKTMFTSYGQPATRAQFYKLKYSVEHS